MGFDSRMMCFFSVFVFRTAASDFRRRKRENVSSNKILFDESWHGAGVPIHSAARNARRVPGEGWVDILCDHGIVPRKEWG